jgi:hypothetical protein
VEQGRDALRQLLAGCPHPRADDAVNALELACASLLQQLDSSTPPAHLRQDEDEDEPESEQLPEGCFLCGDQFVPDALSDTPYALDPELYELFARRLQCGRREPCARNPHAVCAFMYARHDRYDLLKDRKGCEGCWNLACDIWNELKEEEGIDGVASIWQDVCAETFGEFFNAAASGPVRNKVITIDSGSIIHAAAMRFDAPGSMPVLGAARFEHTGNVSAPFECALAPCSSLGCAHVPCPPGTYTLDEAKLLHVKQHSIVRLSHVLGHFTVLCNALCLNIPCQPEELTLAQISSTNAIGSEHILWGNPLVFKELVGEVRCSFLPLRLCLGAARRFLLSAARAQRAARADRHPSHFLTHTARAPRLADCLCMWPACLPARHVVTAHSSGHL